ncbi:hypothetical protein WN943_019530 [Citrus x changshan-huyou]
MLPPRKWYSRRAETQRARFMELKEDLQKGFYKDMAEKNRSTLSSSSSSSSSPKEGVKFETCDRNFPYCSVVADNFLHFNSPHCSEVVDEFLDCDWSDASFLEKGTPDEQKLKRAGFMKLKSRHAGGILRGPGLSPSSRAAIILVGILQVHG